MTTTRSLTFREGIGCLRLRAARSQAGSSDQLRYASKTSRSSGGWLPWAGPRRGR